MPIYIINVTSKNCLYCNGYIEGTSWNQLRSAAEADAIIDIVSAGYRPTRQLARGILKFDTSIIPDSEIIISAGLSLKNHLHELVTFSQPQYIGLVSASVDGNLLEHYAIGNFGGTRLAEDQPYWHHEDNSYKIFNFNSNGLAYINKIGYTRIGFRLAWDIDNFNPGGTSDYWTYLNFITTSYITLSVTTILFPPTAPVSPSISGASTPSSLSMAMDSRRKKFRRESF